MTVAPTAPAETWRVPAARSGHARYAHRVVPCSWAGGWVVCCTGLRLAPGRAADATGWPRCPRCLALPPEHRPRAWYQGQLAV